jgi:hypothetical protein
MASRLVDAGLVLGERGDVLAGARVEGERLADAAVAVLVEGRDEISGAS